jgi:hypothetical protein
MWSCTIHILCEPLFISMINSRRLKLAGMYHARRDAYRLLVGNPERMKPLVGGGSHRGESSRSTGWAREQGPSVWGWEPVARSCVWIQERFIGFHEGRIFSLPYERHSASRRTVAPWVSPFDWRFRLLRSCAAYAPSSCKIHLTSAVFVVGLLAWWLWVHRFVVRTVSALFCRVTD